MTTRIAVTGAGGFIGGHILEVLRRTHEDSDLDTDFVAITHEVDMCNKDTVAAIAASGVDVISCGWITHSAPILDIGLDET